MQGLRMGLKGLWFRGLGVEKSWMPCLASITLHANRVAGKNWPFSAKGRFLGVRLKGSIWRVL